MANRLRQEKSPYLLQHGDNPVDWYPWCQEAFRRARQEDKPVFLSIGYSTCHWCHVMARESFADEEVADALNRDFISIKVDREERPDVDAVYMEACQAFTGSGGWPLTILMTPEQKPFFAGTYLPKRGVSGHLGLLELLERAAGLWKGNREGLLETGNRVAELLSREAPSQEGEPDRPAPKTSQHCLFQKSGLFSPKSDFCTRYNEGKCHIAKERRTYQIHKGTAASYVAAAVQIPGNRLVPDCCRRPADIVLPPKKVPVGSVNPRQCGHPWENRTKSPSGSHRFPVLTGDRFFRTKVLPDGSGCPSCPYGSKCRTGS